MTLQPKIIVADASITKPKNMEVSCEKENPFHATVEKGFYKLQIILQQVRPKLFLH
jgi:hypothetical protein